MTTTKLRKGDRAYMPPATDSDTPRPVTLLANATGKLVFVLFDGEIVPRKVAVWQLKVEAR